MGLAAISCRDVPLWNEAELSMPGTAAGSLVTSADGLQREWRCERLYVAISPRRDDDMRSPKPRLVAPDRTLNQQLAAEHRLAF